MIYLFTCGKCCAKIIYHNVDKSLWWFHSSETSLKELSKNTISFADPQLQLLLWNSTHFRPPIEKQLWHTDIVATTVFAVLFSLLIFLSFQALEASKKEHSLTLKIVKEKIISTE